jgi:hypothetical protein
LLTQSSATNLFEIQQDTQIHSDIKKEHTKHGFKTGNKADVIPVGLQSRNDNEALGKADPDMYKTFD